MLILEKLRKNKLFFGMSHLIGINYSLLGCNWTSRELALLARWDDTYNLISTICLFEIFQNDNPKNVHFMD
jgi:hypothetical protein